MPPKHPCASLNAIVSLRADPTTHAPLHFLSMPRAQHHKYPFDYAASEYGVVTQFNPTKFIIDTCAKLGMVYDRKRATGMWAREKAKRDKSL